MSNTTTPRKVTRRPSVATMEARLAKAGSPVDPSRTIGELHAAYDGWVDAGKPTVELDAPTKRTRKTAKKVTEATPATTEAPAPARTPANCGCGCGAPTVTARATFLAGHDARMAGELGRAIAADPTNADLTRQYDGLTAKLQSKVDGIADTARRRLAAKAAKVAAKAAADAAYAEAMAKIG